MSGAIAVIILMIIVLAFTSLHLHFRIQKLENP